MGERVWEYTIWRAPTGSLGAMERRINELGSTGWEVVGFASADKTLGLNEYSIVMKRPRLARFPPPEDETPGWKADPAGKFEHRWWNGLHWDAAVYDQGENASDFPRIDPGA